MIQQRSCYGVVVHTEFISIKVNILQTQYVATDLFAFVMYKSQDHPRIVCLIMSFK